MEDLKIRVLAVDDEPAKLKLLAGILGGMDLELVKAGSGREALKLLLEGDFAVILMDINMPGMDGFETAGLIRQRDELKETPIIFITAYPDTESKSFAGYQAGAVDYLVTPIVPQVLKAKVKVFCGLFETRKTLELQFRQAQKMEAVGRLAGGIAHDFNNLLTAIEGYAEFLVRSLAPDDKRRDDALEIKKAAESAATLTRQLLALSRRQLFQLRVLDCNAVIRDTQKMLKRLIGENITLALDLANEECRIKADPGQLEQVIMNLIVNARDAMPRGGKVTIKTENMELSEKYSKMHMEVRPGPHVMITVTDTGCGMDPAVMANVFEPFFTTKEAGKGTGLGLATVYGIVKQSGGNIYVYSEPGLGTTFKIYLPRVAEEIEAGPEPARPEGLRGSETILLVEDDDGVRGFALRALREKGYTAIEARNAEEAVRICKEKTAKISLVLTDTVMPGMNGHELYALISKECPGVKVIFMSGYTDPELGGIRLTVDNLPFLQKPVSADDLVKKVREVLDSPVAARV